MKRPLFLFAATYPFVLAARIAAAAGKILRDAPKDFVDAWNFIKEHSS